MPTRLTPLALAGLTLVLTACGGGDDDDSPANARGTAIGAPVQVSSLTTAQLDAAATASGVAALVGPAQCDVTLTRIEYNTVGGKDEATNATAAVMVPSGGAACTGARPVLLYAHGTSFDKKFDATIPSAYGEAGLALAQFAAKGYVVVMPNYTGYGASKLPYHPYLNADAQSKDVVDGLRAAKSLLPKISTGTSMGKALFVAGYSQGGHVAMATVRALQSDYASEFKLTASVPMSGPYALSDLASLIFSGQQIIGASLFVPMMVDSFQNSYGNVYGAASEVYAAPYSSVAVGLLPANDPAAATAKLPAGADGSYRTLYDQGDGQPYLLAPAFVSATKAGTNGFAKAVVKNTLLDWTPKAPMALCNGGLDPTVPGFNSVKASASFSAKGVTVPHWDLENAASVPPTIKAAFDALKAQTVATSGEAGMIAAYHGGLVPPFCMALAKGYFDQLAAAAN